MQLRRPAGIYQVFLMGVLVLATIVFTGRQHYGEAHNADEDQHAHHQTERVCRGFVVLPNGFAVLSSLPLSPAYASVGERQSTAHSGITIANTDHTADAPEYLLGYTHGQKIVLQDAMLCVPIVGAGTLKWTAVSHTAALTRHRGISQGHPATRPSYQRCLYPHHPPGGRAYQARPGTTTGPYAAARSAPARGAWSGE